MLKSLKSYWSGSGEPEAAASEPPSGSATAEAAATSADDAETKTREESPNVETSGQQASVAASGWQMSMSMDTAMLSGVLKPEEMRQTFSKARDFFGKLSSVAMQKTSQILEESSPIISDFSREQKKFLSEQQQREALQQQNSVVPWYGYANEDAIKKQVLALSLDKRNFVRNPPGGSQFVFVLNEFAGAAKIMLAEDPNLSRMRFELVPKVVKEDAFWRNYFYRVSLIKQSAQLAEFANKSPKSQSPQRTAVGKDSESAGASEGAEGGATSAGAEEKLANAPQANELELANEEADSGDFVSESLAETVTLSSDELAQLNLSGNSGAQKTDADKTNRKDDSKASKKADDAAGSDWSQDFELVADGPSSPAAQNEPESLDDELEREILAEIALEEAQKAQ